MLDDFYFADPRVTLVPLEHIGRDGIAPEFAAKLHRRRGWTRPRVALLGDGIALYSRRLEDLARRCGTLAPPRLRSVAVVADADAVRPYAPMLNVGAWTLYECDLDPEHSHVELVAYLLAHGDRMAESGEVTLVGVHLAAWWLERSAEERAAFQRAADASRRPDADVYRAIAAALPWLREVRHTRLRPPRKPGGHRAIPGTGLLVPRAREAEPDRLVGRCREAATATLERFHALWRGRDDAAADALCAWLRDDVPPLAITCRDGSLLWQPSSPADTSLARRELKPAGSAALRDVAADLAVIASHTRRFRAALTDPTTLPRPDPETAQSGYAYMHRELGLVAYNLHEPGIERLSGPALPWARAMLGARTVHEWAHLAVDGGYVPRAVDDAAWTDLVERFAALLDAAMARAPRQLRERCAPDLRVLARERSAGAALVDVFASRLPDYRANLLAQRFLSDVERETYVRQNVRPLAAAYRPEQLWRLLVRYLYELQYLAFSEVPDARRYFLECTGFARDFFATRALDEERFAALAEAAEALCTAHRVAEGRLRPASAPSPA
ncbi:MAG: hypothetical protein AB1689_24465 [Thermodesulfobacteriota bacterium]